MSAVRKMRCLVGQVTDHGDQVYTIELTPERPVPAFRPGQFLHLALDEYDPSGFWPESRVFSIASPPCDKSKLTVIYSVKGRYTTRMARELSVGKAVWVKLPYGEFVVDGERDAVMIAGGTGITAFQGFIQGLHQDHPHRVVLLYGARRSALLLGRDSLENKRRHVPLFSCYYYSEAGGDDGVISGRVTLEGLKDCALSESAIYYLAGPPPMVTALSNDLAKRGVSVDQIRVDAWE